MVIDEMFVRNGLELQGVPVPEDELENVRLRFQLWMSAFEEIEASLGERMNEAEPIPPVYPRLPLSDPPCTT